MAIFSADATQILQKRYLLKDPSGHLIETPEEMLMRVSRAAAAAEKDYAYWEEQFYAIMAAKRFLPNSPTLANAGRPQAQLAACFVLPVPDSIEGIFETMKKAALIHKTGGGTGFSFSQIRPRDDLVSSTGGVASGPLSFITCYNCATDAVKQGGMRRGANMAVLDYWHPDIFDFISAKKEEGALSNFNISVGVDDKFMHSVINDLDVEMINPRTGKPAGKTFRANDLMDAIVMAAWENGEPGILFFDHINAGNSVPGLGPLIATNPCGEQPLFNYESCNLGSLNLTAYLTDNRDGFREAVDWELLARDISIAVRFLDNVIDVNHYIFPEIEQITRANRKIGLGVMGFADLLTRLGLPYGSEEALTAAEALMSFIQDRADRASTLLGEEKGSFPNIGKSSYCGKCRRNATVLTVAPTGTLSMLADTSSGIEPLFGLVYTKEALDGRNFRISNGVFEHSLQEMGLWSKDLLDEVVERGGISGVRGLPQRLRDVFATAFEIAPEWHVRIQAAFQKYVDNAVSKTINFPNNATPQDIRKVYLQAWNQGCKGLTTYRLGSRESQVLKFASKDLDEGENAARCPSCSG